MKNERQFLKLALVCCAISLLACNSKQESKQLPAQTSKDTVQTPLTANKAAQVYAKTQVPVLCYHRITEGSKSEYAVTPATFEAHIKILADSGYQAISPDELYDYLVYNKTLPAKPVLISFDDSRIEHIEIAAPTLQKYGFRGVFFIMTITNNKKNYLSTEQIATLSKNGHTIGVHSWDHTMVTKYADTSDWEKQVATPQSKLAKLIAKKVSYFAYPNGVCNHEGAVGMSKYMKLAFILSTKRDSLQPLQTVRRMIVPEWTAQGLLKSMHKTF
ncbi:MAG: hypothetical protein AUK44_00105 [Porphyromonadaceae bacterium CG2_30_38_12]|nr:MAG: hypothetical protein AUK44_00105 [Porphyromonadaceae bacterium CG2_30_38_12]